MADKTFISKEVIFEIVRRYFEENAEVEFGVWDVGDGVLHGLMIACNVHDDDDFKAQLVNLKEDAEEY